MEATLFIEALLYSLQTYERIIGHVTTMFICSKEIYEMLNKPTTVLGRIVKVDLKLNGCTEQAWRFE